jgi:succinoglycan biosynthesis protein ExoA
VSIIMPALNESKHIKEAIEMIRPKSFDYEILVIDGGSTDKTRELVQELATQDHRIKLIDNAARIQSAGVNLGARLADSRSDIFVRADCHSIYPDHFVETCITALTNKNCASVVVPMRTVGSGCLQTAIAAAQNSYLGNGGSAHRLLSESGFVSHGHHAAFDRRIFLELGGYDETMVANEDAEFDHRLTARGHQIFMSKQATIGYVPRSNLISLSRQYFHYGAGRATNCRKHGLIPAPRQIFPALIATGVGSSFMLSFSMPLALLFPASYLISCLVYGFILGIRSQSACHAIAGLAAIVMHMSWGVGFLYEFVRTVPSFLPSRSSKKVHISGKRK